jgi:hypothetical protein
MPKMPPPAIREPNAGRRLFLLESVILACVLVIFACAGVAAHFPDWHNVSMVIAVLFMIPMCWAGEETLRRDGLIPRA